LDEKGRRVEVKVIAGQTGDVTALPPAPDSWAADPANEVAIWTIKMEPGAQWMLPAAGKDINRTLYFYRGDSIEIGGNTISAGHSFSVKTELELAIRNGNETGYLFLLQGKPIDEPVVQYGPFVMNTEAEIRQTITDYRETEFGGWPWPRRDQVHPRTQGRFAKYADGTIENPYSKKTGH
jgi:hypothetical protein